MPRSAVRPKIVIAEEVSPDAILTESEEGHPPPDGGLADGETTLPPRTLTPRPHVPGPRTGEARGVAASVRPPFRPVPKPAPRRKGPKGPRVPDDVKHLVLERAGYVCDRCAGRLDGWSGHSKHHRDAGGMGGGNLDNSPENVVVLCGSGTTGCHGYVEGHRDQCGPDGEGWSVTGTVRGPGDVPVLRHGRHWVIPRSWGWEAVDPPHGGPC